MTSAEGRRDARDRFREDVKAVALEQLTEGGPESVSVNAIGKRLGVSGPALYRYFSGRGELLTELALDAYADLDAELAGHDGSALALARAYRSWALRQPHRYGLLFDSPASGYDNQDLSLVEASKAVMRRLQATLDTSGVPAPEPSTAALAGELRRWDRTREPADSLRAIGVWIHVHGLVSLEIGGSFESMGIDGGRLLREQLS